MKAPALLILALPLALLCSCSESPKPPKTVTPPLAHEIDADGTPVPGSPEPEVVQLEKIETLDGMLHVTVGNPAGTYVLVCNPMANGEIGPHTCLSPLPQRNYLLFRKYTKWLMKGAQEPMSMDFMQGFSVTYRDKENIALLPAKTSEEEYYKLYWLLFWTPKKSR